MYHCRSGAEVGQEGSKGGREEGRWDDPPHGACGAGEQGGSEGADQTEC